MELRQLERFLAVVDAGTLAAAARGLGLTQQALSASISGLEAELDVRLFDRGPGGNTRVTDYGRTLIEHARSQIAGDRRARAALASLRNAETGSVTVGIGETFAGDIVAKAVTGMLADRPGLRINLVEGYSELILDRLYGGEFDFAAIGVSGFALKPGFESRHIYTALDVVACRRGHPLARKSSLTLSDLEGFAWLVPYSRPSDVNVIQRAFIDEGLPPPDRFIGSDAYRIGMKLMAGNDFLLMTSPALVTSNLASKLYGLRILEINRPTVRREARLIVSRDRPMTPAAAAFFETVRETSANFPAELEKRVQAPLGSRR